MFRKSKGLTHLSPKKIAENLEYKGEEVPADFKAKTHNLLLCYLGHLTLKLATDQEQQKERKFKSSLVIDALTEVNQANTRLQVSEILSRMLVQYTEYMKANSFAIVPTDGMNQISHHLDELARLNVVEKNTLRAV